MQNDEVNAVRAPSALGKSADIKPMIKITDMIAGILEINPKATDGNRLSPVILVCPLNNPKAPLASVIKLAPLE